MDNVTPESVPVLEIVIVPVDGVPPWGEIRTCSTSTPPELLPLTGVKLVTSVTVHVPFATIADVDPPPAPEGERNRVKKPPPDPAPLELPLPVPSSSIQSLPPDC